MHKKDGNDKWEVFRKGKPHQLADGLTKDHFITWTHNREMLLRAHLMNDPNFKEFSNKKQDGDTNKNMIEPNCVVQPLLEIVTSGEIEIDEDSIIRF